MSFIAALSCVSCTPGVPPLPSPSSEATAFVRVWPAPPPVPPPEPADPLKANAIPDSGVAGEIDGHPFIVRNVNLWTDPTGAYIAFEDVIPRTDGRYDPRARRVPTTAFLLRLNMGDLQPGIYHAADDHIPESSPLAGITLQIVRRGSQRVALVEQDWNALLEVDAMVTRRSRDGILFGVNLYGRVAVRFKKPRAWIVGRFVAHDALREDEVLPDQPAIPTPLIPDPRPTSPDKTG